MRGFEQHLREFQKRGVEIAAISVDTNEDSRKLCQSQGYSYPFLSDANAAVIRQYGVLHAGGGEGGHDIARPAEFLVDAKGVVRWVNLTEDLRVRARPEAVLRVIDQLQPPLGARLQRPAYGITVLTAVPAFQPPA